MKATRRRHSAAFKAEVALAALRGDKSIAELTERYAVHPNQIHNWKKQLQDRAAEAFGPSDEKRYQRDVEIQKLYAKIGQLTIERDQLSKRLKNTT